MDKEMIVTGNPARRIEVSEKTKRRIESEELAAALGAELQGAATAWDTPGKCFPVRQIGEKR